MSAAIRTKFDADNILSEEDNESKLEDLEAELKNPKTKKTSAEKTDEGDNKYRQEWIRSSRPSVSDVLEFSSASKKRICNADTLIMFVL